MWDGLYIVQEPVKLSNCKPASFYIWCSYGIAKRIIKKRVLKWVFEVILSFPTLPFSFQNVFSPKSKWNINSNGELGSGRKLCPPRIWHDCCSVHSFSSKLIKHFLYWQFPSLFKSSESVVLLESLEFIRGTSLLWQREVSCREQRACLCSKEAFTRANILWQLSLLLSSGLKSTQCEGTSLSWLTCWSYAAMTQQGWHQARCSHRICSRRGGKGEVKAS